MIRLLAACAAFALSVSAANARDAEAICKEAGKLVRDVAVDTGGQGHYVLGTQGIAEVHGDQAMADLMKKLFIKQKAEMDMLVERSATLKRLCATN